MNKLLLIIAMDEIIEEVEKTEESLIINHII